MPRSMRNLSCLEGMRTSQWGVEGTHNRCLIVSILPHSIYPVSTFKSVRRPFRYEARLGSVDDSTRLTRGGTTVAGCLGATRRRVIPFKSTNTEIQNSSHLIVCEIGRYLVVEKHRHVAGKSGLIMPSSSDRNKKIGQ